MYDETVRMSSLPAWVCVGTESGMDSSDSRFIVFVLKICEEGTELSYQEHTFIYNGTAGHGYHVSIVVALLENSPGNIQLPVKVQSLFYIFRFFNKSLHDMRHTLFCLMSQNIRIYRNLTEA